MRILAIETSAPHGTIALWDPETGMHEDAFGAVRNHAAELAPRVRDLLDGHGGLGAVEAYGVSIGPGSFTGLRIGVSFLKGLAAAVPRPAVGVSTLQVMATQASQGGLALAVLDARRGEVFAGLYGPDRRPDPRLPDGLYEASDLAARLQDTLKSEKVLVVGDHDIASIEGVVRAPPEVATPLASTVAMLAAPRLAAGEGGDAGHLDPAYHQRSAAEVNLGLRAPDDAKLHLADLP